ncbi:MAG: hypothetical protein IJV75_00305 [Alphaproteobacteria bacterium]|nr:hypothetical protein [Alphaproteobacteria bacterium]
MANRTRKLIDINTLKIYPSVTDCAKTLNVSKPSICQAIVLGTKVKGVRLEYLSEWLHWTSEEKEKACHWPNVGFY